MNDTASDPFTRASGPYVEAWRNSGHVGDPFSVDQPHRSSWPIVAACFLFGVVALIAVEIFS